MPFLCPALQDDNNRFLPDGRCGRKAGKNPPQPPMERERNGGSTNPTAGTRNATFEKLQFFPEVSLRWAAEAGGSCGGMSPTIRATRGKCQRHLGGDIPPHNRAQFLPP